MGCASLTLSPLVRVCSWGPCLPATLRPFLLVPVLVGGLRLVVMLWMPSAALALASGLPSQCVFRSPGPHLCVYLLGAAGTARKLGQVCRWVAVLTGAGSAGPARSALWRLDPDSGRLRFSFSPAPVPTVGPGCWGWSPRY